MQCDSCGIKNLIYQYADYLDRGDLRSVAALFDGGRLVALMQGGAESEIVGEQAVLMTPADTRVMAEVAGATVTVIPDAAHLSNIEQPHIFTETVASFLGGES